MLTTEEFQRWCHQLQLSKEVQELIATIRCSEPVRKVREDQVGAFVHLRHLGQ